MIYYACAVKMGQLVKDKNMSLLFLHVGYSMHIAVSKFLKVGRTSL